MVPLVSLKRCFSTAFLGKVGLYDVGKDHCIGGTVKVGRRRLVSVPNDETVATSRVVSARNCGRNPCLSGVLQARDCS